MKNKILVALAAIGLFAVATATQSHASGSATGNAVLTVNYLGKCEMSPGNPSFDYADSDTGTLRSVVLNCSNGLPWALTVDAGGFVAGEIRQLSHSNGTGRMAYRLYKDLSQTSEIGVSTNTVGTGVGTGEPVFVEVIYSVHQSDNMESKPLIGTYTDTLGYKVDF